MVIYICIKTFHKNFYCIYLYFAYVNKQIKLLIIFLMVILHKLDSLVPLFLKAALYSPPKKGLCEFIHTHNTHRTIAWGTDWTQIV